MRINGWSPLPPRLPWGWMALAGFVFAAGIIWSLVEVNRSGERHGEVLAEARGIMELEKEAELDAAATVESLEKVVRDYFNSRSVDELLRHVRHPERVGPLMEKYYSDRQPVPNRVKSILSLDPLTIGTNGTFWIARCELADGSEDSLLVEAPSPDVAKVDWEIFVCYQPVAWDLFATSRPAGYTGDFRVYVEEDTFYAHEFSDSSLYICYRLTTLDAEEVLYGYVKRNTPLAERINGIIGEANGEPAPMILRLSVPEDPVSKRGVLVESVVCQNWIFIDFPEVGK